MDDDDEDFDNNNPQNNKDSTGNSMSKQSKQEFSHRGFGMQLNSELYADDPRM